MLTSGTNPTAGGHRMSATPRTIEPVELTKAKGIIDEISGAFSKKVVGQEQLRTSLLVAMMAEGHILLESVPGLAKTLAASTLAKAVPADFARIQCTPDLLPSDIIGTKVYDPRNHEFETHLDPLHDNFLLPHTLNRHTTDTRR